MQCFTCNAIIVPTDPSRHEDTKEYRSLCACGAIYRITMVQLREGNKENLKQYYGTPR